MPTTRSGHPARIIATNLMGPRPILAIIRVGRIEVAIQYTASGRRWGDDINDLYDLMEIPECQPSRLSLIYTDSTSIKTGQVPLPTPTGTASSSDTTASPT